MKTNEKTQKIILTGLMTALVTVATMAISFPIPFTNGYIHLGDSMIFISVLVLGWKYGAFASGFGSFMADMFLGYAHWAPWTLCIKGLMAVVMGIMIQMCLTNRKYTMAAVLLTSGIWIGFNLVVQKIVLSEARNNSAALFETASVDNASALETVVNGIQNQLMLIALLIPLALIIISFIIRKKEHIVIPIYQILAMTTSGLFMVFGYYIAGGILYGNFAISAFSIPANMLQFVGGFFIASVISAALCKTPAKKYFTYKTLLSSN